MPEKKMNLDEILELNPAIDPKDIERLRKHLEDRRREGRSRARYGLVVPYGGQRASISSSEADHEHGVTLIRRRV